MRVNIELVNYAVENNSIKHLAVFMRLKSLFSNSCIYNYTHNSLSRKSGYSLSFIKKHMSFFKKNGWVREHNGNLVFIKLSDLKGNYRNDFYDMKIQGSDTWKSILKKLRLLIIRQREKLFYSKKSNDPNGASETFTITNAFVGKLNKQSRSSASRLMRWGMKEGILTLKSTARVVDEVYHPCCWNLPFNLFGPTRPSYTMDEKSMHLNTRGKFLPPKLAPLNPFSPYPEIFRDTINIHQGANEVRFY